VQLEQDRKRQQELGRQAAWHEADIVIQQLQQQVADSQQALKLANLARNKLEEDMKQAFMRGVCALNIEVRIATKQVVTCLVDDRIGSSTHE
jgi:hypothetical protein